MKSLASRTQLPPSPELNALSSAEHPPPLPSLHLGTGAATTTNNNNNYRPPAAIYPPPWTPPSPTVVKTQSTTTTTPPPRLRSVARYTTYRPQSSLVTSPYLPALHTSLGAVAAAHGVAIFRLDQPATPVALLHCHSSASAASTSSSTTSSASTTPTSAATTANMAFGPDATCLAAARGSASNNNTYNGGTSIWIWNVHAAGPHARVHAPSTVVSLDWRGATKRELLACTPQVACVWDLRVPSSAVKPTLRFGWQRGTRGVASYVQVAAAAAPTSDEATSSSSHVALLDATGVLRIWDVRYTQQQDTTSASSAATDLWATQTAFEAVGVGVQAAAHGAWVVWGYDRVQAPAVAKVWGPRTAATDDSITTTQNNNNNNNNHAMDDGSTDERSLCLWDTLSSSSSAFDGLACARVCNQHIVTLSSAATTYTNDTNSDVEGITAPSPWQASVYKIEQPGKVKSVVSFAASAATRQFGSLCAASVALSTFGTTTVEQGSAHFPHRTSGLLLVNITQKGYITTHSIPEAMESLPSTEENKADTANTNRINKENQSTSLALLTKIIPDDKDLGDVARSWGSNPDLKEEHRTDDSHGVLPFDMDVPVAYSIPSSDVQHALRRSTGVSGTVGESVPATATTASTDVVDVASPTVRVQVDTRRIPCPRLCGASFGPGGLAVFANGQVERMWAWYTSSSVGLPHHMRTEDDVSSRPATVPGEKRGLRTMNDLQNMMKAAKEAQWGEQSEGEASSDTSQQLGLGFFEDGDSDDDSSDSVEVDAEHLGELTEEKAKGMYESYFGDFRRPLTRAGSQLARPGSSTDGDSVGGPSSDMLAPVVKVTRAFEKIAMHSQSQELALSWKLGDLPFDVSSDRHESGGALKEMDPAINESQHSIPASLSPTRFLLPGYRLGGQTSQGRPHFSGILPSNIDQAISPPKIPRPKSQQLTNPYDVDEAGVHGGEYSVRPHMKESMVFLKKLVNYQQESGTALAGSSGYRGLMSPPDGPTRSRSMRTTRPQMPSSPTKKQGAYVLRRSKPTNENNLESIKLTCEYNARASTEIGEHEKAETWKLLAQVVAGRLQVAGGGRWKPKASMAVGGNLVRLVLQYYETMGDVQMLATIVCVLRQEKTDSKEDILLLSDETDVKCDGYLRRYSDLLYSWRLLSLRAQINKRLRYTYESREAFGVSFRGTQEGGITVFSECPHCHQPTTTNYCNNCSDYAFRCSICDTAVRGLFTICNECGHGGHISHMHSWFQTQKMCPTGCGCRCVLSVQQSE